MKRFVLTLLTLVLLTVLAACGGAEPDPVTAPAEPVADAETLTFSIDPSTQQAQLLEAPDSASATDVGVQGKSGRRTLTGKDLKVKSFKVTFQKNNTLKLDAAFKNISACNLSNFTFSQGKRTRNIVSSTEPVVTAKDLGGDNVLSPSEVTKPLTFKVQHKGKPFVYQVKVQADVGCEAPPPPPTGECTDPVTIPDDFLMQSVRFTLQKPEGDITCTDMASLTELIVVEPTGLDEYGTPLTNLEGLQFATRLKKLFFFIPTKDIPPTYFEPLSALTNLTDLGLASNRVDVFDPDYNTDLEDVSFTLLAKLANLTSLVLPETQVGDISFLNSLTNLVNLDLSDNIIADYSPISSLIALKKLDLSSTFLGDNLPKISDLSFLRGATSLTSLNLGRNAVSNLTPLRGLTSLESLQLGDNAVSDLTPLRGLTNLDYLGLSGNNLSDLTPLSGLTNLVDLGLSDNSITDFSPVAGLTNLESLELGSNAISDLTPSKGLTNLIYLDLNSNDITDLSPLASLTKLDRLYLEYNFITDLSPLVANAELGKGKDLIALYNNCLDTAAAQTLSDIKTVEDRNPNTQNIYTEYQREGEDAVGCDSAPPPPPVGECADPVNIPDDILEGRIRETLNKPEGDITCADMASLTELDARAFDEMDEPTYVRSLEGLQFATNLTSLSFYNYDITAAYFEPLSGLTTLERLSISNYYFPGDDYPNIDMTFLSDLTNLTSLSLPDSQVGDLSVLAGLTNLTELSIPSSNAADYSPLSGLTKLVTLNLSSQLIGFKGQVTDLGFAENLTALDDLNLSDNAIRDLTPLVNNEGLGYDDDVISLYVNCFGESEAVKAKARKDIATIEARNPNVINVNVDLDNSYDEYVCSPN